MNLYEWEGKKIFQKYGINIPKGVLVRRGDDVGRVYDILVIKEVVVKAQILSGKRGKNNGIFFCDSKEAVVEAVEKLFSAQIRGQYVAAILIEEKLEIAEEKYLSITYDTNKKQPVMIFSEEGGVNIEEVDGKKIKKEWLDVRQPVIASHSEAISWLSSANEGIASSSRELLLAMTDELWKCFIEEDARVVEINPLVKTSDGRFVAADAKIAIDEDAFYRHEEWKSFEPRTMLGRLPTEREASAKKIDEGEAYYRGTAGKYIEMDGDVAILFSGGGASIANMDALINAGQKPANYTEYSGNPPREKVYQIAKVVLSKPGIRGLWIAGGVANFTNISETFQGIVDALDELKPKYPIVVRRAGPFEGEGMAFMRSCAERNGLNMKLFGKETSMSETAEVLSEMIRKTAVSGEEVTA